MDHRTPRHPALLAAVLLVLALTACRADQSPSASAEVASPSPSVQESREPAQGQTIGLADIPDLVEQVQPSVVSIIRDQGEGSGVIWSEDGLIVTNHHVVEGSQSLTVAFADGQRVPAEVVATDPRTDLAVIDADRNDLQPAIFADELPEIGELALAMGNPVGFENSVTQGIISGLHRNLPGAARQAPALVDLIQTDAPISPGNSGGALVGGDGQIVGINVAYLPPNPQSGRGAVSLGFAIPSPTVQVVVEQLLESGTVQHPYLGIRPATVTPELARQLGIQATEGVAVLDVTPRGPADEAGLQPGDIITSLEGEDLTTAEDLLGTLRDYDPGDEVVVTVQRSDETREIEVTLGELPPPTTPTP